MAALLGAGVGVVLPVVTTRVPERVSLRIRPFSEARAALTTVAGWVTVVVTSALFAGVAARFADRAVAPAYLVLTGALVALSVIDLRTFLLPNRIVYPLAAVSVVLLGAGALLDGDGGDFVRALLGALAAFAVFAALHLASPRSMGFGDVKLAFVLGLFLAYLGWGELVLGLFLGFLYGAVVGIGLIATGRRSRRDHVPFGPFLAAGTLTAVLVGAQIVDWYSGRP